MATFDYTSRDYLSIRQDLINRAAQVIPEWDSTDASEFGNVFIDLWAYMGDILHFYIDRAASETFLDTATQRESVLAIANLMDYVPASARASRGTCTIKLSSFPTASVKGYTITSASATTVSGSVVITFTTSSNHELTSGQLISVSGMSPSSFNISNVVVNTIPTSTTFTVLATQYSALGLTPPSSGTNSTAGGNLDYNLAYTVPQFTVFNAYDANGDLLDFYLSSAVTFTQTNTNAVASLIQGKIINNESLGNSSGRENQTFTLTKANVDSSSVTIQVFEGPLSSGSPTAVTYQYVPYLSTAGFADKVFTTRLTSDNYTQIIFGNAFNGAIPTTNALIMASYRTTAGPLGNVPANNIRFINGASSSYIDIVSSSIFSGGADVESLESIRTNVSRLFRTQDRAVSLQDYKDLTLQIPGVSKATAVYSSSNVTIYPVPHLSEYPPAPITAGSQKVIIEIPTPMAESIDSYFSTRSMLGVTAKTIGPNSIPSQSAHGTFTNYIECTPVYVGMQVYVKNNHVQSWVKEEVSKAIRSLLSFEQVEFGKTLTVGEVYRAALSVNGVDYVVLTTLNTVYSATPETIGTVINVSTTATKLLCFTDGMNAAPTAVNLAMYGGITGSN